MVILTIVMEIKIIYGHSDHINVGLILEWVLVERELIEWMKANVIFKIIIIFVECHTNILWY